MMPNQWIFQGKLHIIRPFAYISKELIEKYVKEQGLPSIENRCPMSKTSKRMHIKKLLRALEEDNKHIRDNIYKSLRHVKVDYLPVDMRDMK